MDNLVINTDFVGELYLPVIDKTLTEDLLYFNTLVAQRQKYHLTKLLGYQLYSEFDAGIQEVTPLQKWIDLRDGAEFTAKDINGNDITLKWDGLANMLKYLIYADYIESLKFEVSETGVKGINTDTTLNINVTPTKVMTMYNSGVALFGNEIIGFNESISNYSHCSYLINLFQNFYPTFKELLHESLMIPSAFNFLYRNKTDYTNWYFTQIKPKTHL